MKTKKVLVLLLAITLLSLIGCDKAKDPPLTPSQNYTSSTDAAVVNPPSSHPLRLDIKLNELKDIVDFSFSDNLIITRDGTLYKLGKFSDGTLIKKIDNNNYVRFIDDLIIDIENNVYEFNTQNHTTQKSTLDGRIGTHGVVPHDVDYSDCALVGGYIFRVSTGMYIKDNSLYINTDNIYFDGFNHTINFQNPAFNFAHDETIEYMIDGTIKTNKGFYLPYIYEQQSPYDEASPTIEFTMGYPQFDTSNLIFVKSISTGLCIVDRSGHLLVYSA